MGFTTLLVVYGRRCRLETLSAVNSPSMERTMILDVVLELILLL